MNNPSNSPFSHFGWIGVAILLLLSSIMAVWAARLTTENARWQTHTLDVLVTTEALLNSVTEAESGQRGYLLTANEAYLKPYLDAAPQVIKQLEALRRLTADNPAQQQRLNVLRPLIDARLAAIEETIVLQRRGNAAAALAIVRGGKGKALMDSIRQIAHEFERDERTLLARHSADFESSIRYTIVAIAAMAFLAVTIIGIVAFRLRQLSETLRQRAAFQRALLDSADAAIISLTPEGMIDSFNPGAERLFGYRADEALGKPVHGLVRNVAELETRAAELTRELGREIKPGFEVFVALARENRPETHEWVYLRKDGVRVPLLLSVSAIRDEHEHITGFIGIARDISAIKQTQRELVVVKNEAELANRAKDSFLATMSHEIRTPLGGLQGMLELLALSPLDHGQRDTLQTARASADSLLRILNDVLDWSKIQEGKLELSPQAASLSQLLAAVSHTYARMASAKQLTLELHVDARLAAAHIVDPLRLTQVLNNFVSNAIKFTQQGKIELRAELIERQADAERIRLSVKDMGAGIDKQSQARLFQSYTQATADTVRMYGGTGLGLSICRSLADLLDGVIELDSAPGMGSTFSITLNLPLAAIWMQPGPVSAAAQAAAVQPLVPVRRDGAAAMPDAPLVLVVDDHPVNRKLMAAQLVHLGLRAEMAENGEAALALWRKGRFSLIITDCHMPKMDGYELARTIRKSEADEARQRIPILAWTANAMPSEAARCEEAGLDELLIKPLTMPQLREVVSTWLRVTVLAPTATELEKSDGYVPVAPLDLARLDDLASGEEEKTEILRELLEQSRIDLFELETALAKCDIPATARIAHRIKGAARMVGADELASVFSAMEQEGKQGSVTDADAAVAALTRVIQWLEVHLGATTGEAEQAR